MRLKFKKRIFFYFRNKIIWSVAIGVMSTTLVSCGGGGSEQSGGAAPTELSYEQPDTALIAGTNVTLSPTVKGSVDTYTVSPGLPNGLTINPKTGEISGTPAEKVDGVTYVIKATNSAGSTTHAVTLTITPQEWTEKSSTGVLELDSSIDASKFLPTSTVLKFRPTGASLAATSAALKVFNNGSEVAASAVKLDSGGIVVSDILQDGVNEIVVLAEDSNGDSLSATTTIWAGSKPLTVGLVTASGGVPASALVTVRLMDQQSLSVQGTTSNGQITFQNVPDRTVLVSALAEGNQIATITTTGGVNTVQLRFLSFNTSSAIENNDFSQGLLGWELSDMGAGSLTPHVEDIGVGTAAVSAPSVNSAALSAASRVQSRQTQPLKNIASSGATALAPGADQDLVITTVGEGPRSVSRTFTVKPGTSKVTVRYRFITSEIPGGFYGSKFNDSYSISIRSAAGGTAFDANSMNPLGLTAFDSGGSTGWRTISLPVSTTGDKIQLDAAVTNVGDGAYDSQLVVDYIAEENLSVTVSSESACVNETVTFVASGSLASQAAWSGGGAPASGSGTSLATRFSTAGEYTVNASANGQSGKAKVRIKELSGGVWVSRYPTSISISDLVSPFRENATSFIDALHKASASVGIAATLRPKQRAYLMHYSYRIAYQGLNPATVPSMAGIEICWVHRNPLGEIDMVTSRAAAAAMVAGYQIVHPPALASRHTQGLAIDMSISWSGNLNIMTSTGESNVITTSPKTGAGNTDLHAIGAGYSVMKLITDAPHWSSDGH